MGSLGFTEQQFPAGVHVCQILHDDPERERSIHLFLLEGLRAGERTSCFFEQLDEAALATFLAQHGCSYEAARDAGILTLTPARSVYFRDERFDPEQLLSNLRQFHADSVRGGQVAARVIGEMLPGVRDVPGGSRLLEYESRVTLLLRDHPMTTVCQYDARRFDGATLLDVLKVHPAMVVRGTVIHNPFFIPPDEYLTSIGG